MKNNGSGSDRDGAPLERTGLLQSEKHGKSTAFSPESKYFLISRPIRLLMFNAVSQPERAPVSDFCLIGRLFRGEQSLMGQR